MQWLWWTGLLHSPLEIGYGVQLLAPIEILLYSSCSYLIWNISDFGKYLLCFVVIELLCLGQQLRNHLVPESVERPQLGTDDGSSLDETSQQTLERIVAVQELCLHVNHISALFEDGVDDPSRSQVAIVEFDAGIEAELSAKLSQSQSFDGCASSLVVLQPSLPHLRYQEVEGGGPPVFGH